MDIELYDKRSRHRRWALEYLPKYGDYLYPLEALGTLSDNDIDEYLIEWLSDKKDCYNDRLNSAVKSDPDLLEAVILRLNYAYLLFPDENSIEINGNVVSKEEIGTPHDVRIKIVDVLTNYGIVIDYDFHKVEQGLVGLHKEYILISRIAYQILCYEVEKSSIKYIKQGE